MINKTLKRAEAVNPKYNPACVKALEAVTQAHKDYYELKIKYQGKPKSPDNEKQLIEAFDRIDATDKKYQDLCDKVRKKAKRAKELKTA